MRTYAEQIQSRSALELTPAGVAQAVHKMHGLDNRPCPPWDGNNPGDTFRQWIQEQTHWLILTNKKYDFWGIMLYDALSGTPKKHARKVPESVRLSYQGYGAIARVLIQEYSGYLEIEFEVSVIRVLHNFPSRKKDELYTHFISKVQMLFEDLDEQLYQQAFEPLGIRRSQFRQLSEPRRGIFEAPRPHAPPRATTFCGALTLRSPPARCQ